MIDNRRLSRLVPVENAAMPDRTVIQWDKDDLDALGLLKVDVLGARHALVHPPRARPGERVPGQRRSRMQDIPAEDPTVYEMIQRADTIGVFQIESRAQMSMLPRLKPARLLRPGDRGGDRAPRPDHGRHGASVPAPPRGQASRSPTRAPEVKKVLERTLGVPIFQEQVMQLAMVAAGFTPGEADQLRRAMAAWKRRGGIEPFRDKLIDGMLARGYAREFAEQIFQQIQGFGEYGFPESHAASFALLVYVSCWLKCHEPAAFACALLNSQPMGFYSVSSIVAGRAPPRRRGAPGRRAGERGGQHAGAGPRGAPALRLGLAHGEGPQGRGGGAPRRGARARRAFASTEDLARRARLDRARPRAPRRGRRAREPRRAIAARRSGKRSRWMRPRALALPPVARAEPAAARRAHRRPGDRRRLRGARASRCGAIRSRCCAHASKRSRIRSAEEVANARNGQIIRAAGIVTCRQRPATASGVIFVTLEDETGYVNLVVWNDLAERQRRELLGARLLARARARCRSRASWCTCWRAGSTTCRRLLGRLATTSHDFH